MTAEIYTNVETQERKNPAFLSGSKCKLQIVLKSQGCSVRNVNAFESLIMNALSAFLIK